MRLIDADKLIITRYDYEGALTLKQRLQRLMDNQPTVEAIPIEWIKEWIKTEPLGMESLIAPEYTIEAMLYWWEKENEVN